MARWLALELLMTDEMALGDDVLQEHLILLQGKIEEKMRAAVGCSEIAELKARVTKLEAWVETAMGILAGQSGKVESALIHLEEATGAYEQE